MCYDLRVSFPIKRIYSQSILGTIYLLVSPNQNSRKELLYNPTHALFTLQNTLTLTFKTNKMLKKVFVSIKPLHVSVFFHDHLQGVLRCALCRYYSSRWFAFFESVLLHSMWPHVYVICVCLVFLPASRQEHQTQGFYTYKHVFNILLVLMLKWVCF
jgi:chromate transport protein ChrA